MTESALLEKVYVEVEARLGSLEKQLDQATDKGRRTAKGIEDIFTRGQLKFNDSLAKKSIAEIEQSAIRLRAHLEKRIEMGAPLYQLQALKDSLNKAESAVETFKRKTEEIPPAVKPVENSLITSFRNIGASILAAGAMYKVFDFLKGSVNESKDAAMSLSKVEQAIKTTGGAAGFTSEQLQQMAGELEDMAGIDGDQIMNDVTAQLLTFTNIAGSSFTRAQKAALDLSAVIGNDLKGQTIQLGKALEDPVSGMTALRRAGVTFTEAQQEQIKKLMAANDLFGAQNIILTEIETKYGGQAEAAKKASGGTMTLAVAWGNLKEQLGNTVMPVLTALAGSLTTISNKTKETSEFWVVLGTVLKVAGGIVLAVKTLVTELGFALGTIGAAWYAAITGQFKKAQDIVSSGFKKMKDEYANYDKTIQGMFSSGNGKGEATQLAEIQKLINQLNNQPVTDPKQESEVEKIISKESELKKSLEEVNKALAGGNLSQFARNELIAKQIELMKELAKYNRITNPDLGSVKPLGLDGLKTNGKISGIPKELTELPKLQKPGVAIGETTSQLERQLALSDALSEGFNNAGSAIASAMGQAAVVFKQANSLLQQFVNGLVSAMVQAFALRAVMMAFNWLTGGLGGASAAIPSPAGSLAPAGGGASAGPLSMNDMAPMLNNINESIQSLNINMMKAKSVIPNINVSIDGKKLVLESIDPETKNLQKQNYIK